MKSVVLAIRFLLEIISVLGIAIGGYLNLEITGIKKWLFVAIIPIMIVIVWSQFGAPNSPRSFTGISKFILEILVYGISIFCFYFLFSTRIAAIYTLIVVLDLAAYYMLGLQGH